MPDRCASESPHLIHNTPRVLIQKDNFWLVEQGFGHAQALALTARDAALVAVDAAGAADLGVGHMHQPHHGQYIVDLGRTLLMRQLQLGQAADEHERLADGEMRMQLIVLVNIAQQAADRCAIDALAIEQDVACRRRCSREGGKGIKMNVYAPLSTINCRTGMATATALCQDIQQRCLARQMSERGPCISSSDRK